MSVPMPKICPIKNKPITQFTNPCNDCHFFDGIECRIIATDENLKELLRLVKRSNK